MTQWVLVLMISGTRTFRIYGEDHAVHGGEFFLLPPHVRHYGLQFDRHEAYFTHFQAEGAESPSPTELDPGHILLPLWGQVPLELPCFDLMEYAACHRAPPFFSESFLSSQIQAILYQLSLAMQKRNCGPSGKTERPSEFCSISITTKAGSCKIRTTPPRSAGPTAT